MEKYLSIMSDNRLDELNQNMEPLVLELSKKYRLTLYLYGATVGEELSKNNNRFIGFLFMTKNK